MTRTARPLGAVLTVLLAGAVVVAVGIGSVHVPVADVVDVVLRRFGLAVDASVVDDRIVWQLRMPRVLGAAATGAGLAIAGAVLQSLTRNDLADPYLLGISGGATVGAVSVIVCMMLPNGWTVNISPYVTTPSPSPAGEDA